MGISDFFRKVRTLLEGEAEPEETYSEVKPESVRTAEPRRSSDSAARLAERMADEYVDPNAPEEDDDLYYDSRDRYYRAPESYPEDDEGAEPDDDFDDLDGDADTYTAPAAPAYREPTTPAAVTADDSAKEEPLPTRTEVTLLQIERLSKQLDQDTLREYQMRLIKLKQDTGAVSALTALRILHEYVPDDQSDDDICVYPDISAR